MSPLAVNRRWMFALKMFILFLGVLLQSCFSEELDSDIKDMLFISAETPNTSFPSNYLFQKPNETKLCFNIQANKNNSECCKDFDCSSTITRLNNTAYSLNLNETSLNRQDIVLMLNATANFSCLPSMLYNSTGFLLNLHSCLKPGGKNIRLSKDGLCGPQHLDTFEEQCYGSKQTKYFVLFDTNYSNRKCVKNTTCNLPGKKPETNITLNVSTTQINTAEAANIMNNLGSKLSLMGNASTAEIKVGNASGVVAKLPKENQTSMNFGFFSDGNVNILKENDPVLDFAQSVYLPKEASKMAVENNGTFAAVLLFPDIPEIDKNRSLYNNKMLGIEMGANILNLSKTISIRFSDVNMTGFNASCVSWDGKSHNGSEANWTTEGCQTKEVNGSVTCQCTHLTFFAILMSPSAISKPGENGNPNISTGILTSSDFKTLTQITKAGCGISMFFLGVALFMHFLIRKTEASQGVQILINLFVALFMLNFCFLINESIANLKILAACVAMAAVLHYSMLATFTWFFMQALHLYINMHKISPDIKYYLCKICTTGWGIPAVVVVGLIASSKYDFITVSAVNGTSVTMCWIPNSTIHIGVNIGYYSIVFLFTLTIFIVTVVQIQHLASQNAKTHDKNSTKKRVFSLLGLFCLLGITWGVAFFSYGPLLLPSYYIFTILNSFQGFFLFVYYYFSSRDFVDDKKPCTHSSSSSSSSSGTTENVYCSSPYG